MGAAGERGCRACGLYVDPPDRPAPLRTLSVQPLLKTELTNIASPPRPTIALHAPANAMCGDSACREDCGSSRIVSSGGTRVSPRGYRCAACSRFELASSVHSWTSFLLTGLGGCGYLPWAPPRHPVSCEMIVRRFLLRGVDSTQAEDRVVARS